MSSKSAIVLLCFFLAIVLLVSSEVAARDLVETSADAVHTLSSAKETSVVDMDDGGYRGGHGGGGRGGGSYCRHGCCGRSYRYKKGGCRCCSYKGEKADAGN